MKPIYWYSTCLILIHLIILLVFFIYDVAYYFNKEEQTYRLHFKKN